MTESKALATTPQGGAMMVGGAVEFNLDGFPADKYNRLIPTQTIMTTDLLMPVVQVVALDFEADTYKSADVPAGHRAPGARALNKFSSAAGLSFYDERRLDDGTNPDLVRVSVMAALILPTGQRITAPGTKELNLNNMSWASPAQRAKFKSTLYEHCSTRARNRAIRAILSLRSSYPEAEIRKPFAVVSFVPNTAHPDVRKAMLVAMAGSIPALYGPEPAKALAAGQDYQVAEAPEEDVSEGQFTEQAAGDEPEWFKGATPAAPVVEQGHRLERMLRAEATKLEADPAMKEPRSDEQADNLKKLLNPIGFDSVVRVLGRVFGLKNIGDITRAQASALFVVSGAEDHFADVWRELDAIAQAQR